MENDERELELSEKTCFILLWRSFRRVEVIDEWRTDEDYGTSGR